MDAEHSVRDEAQMIAAILAGDREQYHELIRPYERSVYKMALSFMKNESDAEDVAQEAFLKAFRKLADFRGQAKFSTWLISITLNKREVVSGASQSCGWNRWTSPLKRVVTFRPPCSGTGARFPQRRSSGRKSAKCCRTRLPICRRYIGKSYFCATWKSFLSRKRPLHSRSQPVQ